MSYKKNLEALRETDLRMLGADDDFYDEQMARESMKMLMREAPHYLVIAYGCRWDGASGYKFSHDLLDTIRRSYDSMIYPTRVSRGGKILDCSESSHDVPLGGTTRIIALTQAEYDRLSKSPDNVWEYAEKMETRI